MSLKIQTYGYPLFMYKQSFSQKSIKVYLTLVDDHVSSMDLVLEVTTNAQVTHSRTGRRISHGYNPASFVAIRNGP